MIRERIGTADIALILGTGLGKIRDRFTDAKVIKLTHE